MTAVIRQHLEALYGPATGAETTMRVAAMLDAFRVQRIKPRKPLTQTDTVLITYGDQIREPDQAPLRTLADFAGHYLVNVVGGIHLLPFHPWSSDDGFSVKDYYSVDPALGDWPDIEKIGSRFDLMFDAVFNHMSAQSQWFQRFLAGDPEFEDFFVTVRGDPNLTKVVRPRALPLLTEFSSISGPQKVWTTFGADQVDLNFKNPRVLLAVLEILLSYVSHGARFIRLDAIAYLWKEIGTPCIHLPQTHEVIQLMRAVLDDIAPGVMLITETNVPHADNISYFGSGANEAQLVYNFALPPLVLHTLATGNAEKLTRWAQLLQLPSDKVAFFNFLASHDGIGLNPARGILEPEEIEALVARTLAHGGFISYKHDANGSRSPYELNINYLDALSAPDSGEPVDLIARKFLTAQAIMLSLRGVPGIYFHSLFGSRSDWAGAEAADIPRRINREKLPRAGLETELAEAGSLRTLVYGGFRNLLKQRRANEAFAPSSPQHVMNLDPRLFAVLRESADGEDRILCLHNITGQPVAVPAHEGGSEACVLAPYETKWLPLPVRH